jgi:hypothetical protein
MRSPFGYRQRNAGKAASVADSLRDRSRTRDDARVEPPIDHRDVTTIMGLLVDIRDDVTEIRRLLEDDGEEEAEETDA